MSEEYLHIVDLPDPAIPQDTLDIRDFLELHDDIKPSSAYYHQLQTAIDSNEIIHRSGYKYYFFSNNLEAIGLLCDKFNGNFIKKNGGTARTEIIEEDGNTTLNLYLGDSLEGSYGFECYDNHNSPPTVCSLTGYVSAGPTAKSAAHYAVISWTKFGDKPPRILLIEDGKRPPVTCEKVDDGRYISYVLHYNEAK